MPRDWEESFTQWAQPPGKAEQERCDNTVGMVRNAIGNSAKLERRSIKVFPHGSYRNRVNVRRESDVDVGVLCYDMFTHQYPPGTSDETFGNVPATYTYRQFKNELEEAMVAYFGRGAVLRGNKAFDIHENTYRVEADVSPFCEHRDYVASGSYRAGVSLLPDSGGWIQNYPERLLNYWPSTNQHYENAVAKNDATSRGFKGVVRILKSLRNEMEVGGIAAAKPVCGLLLECMAWNVPNGDLLHDTWDGNVQAVLRHLWVNTGSDETCNMWCEVNDIKYLFRPAQPWTREQARSFIEAAWSYVGVR